MEEKEEAVVAVSDLLVSNNDELYTLSTPTPFQNKSHIYHPWLDD